MINPNWLFVIACAFLGVAAMVGAKHHRLPLPLKIIRSGPFDFVTIIGSFTVYGLLIWGFFTFGWEWAVFAFTISAVIGHFTIVLAGSKFTVLPFFCMPIGMVLAGWLVILVV